MLTIHLKSESGTLKCEYSEMEKPSRRKYITVKESESDWYKFESSFRELNLSEEAREYLYETYPISIDESRFTNKSFELSDVACEVFEVIKDLHNSLQYTYELVLKSIPVAENKKDFSQWLKEDGVPQAKSILEELRKINSPSSVPVEDNVVAGDGMKTAEEVLRKYIPNFNGSEERFQVMHHASFNSDWDLKMLAAMEEYASQYKQNHSEVENQDELWGNVFAKIKQYGLNNEVLQVIKSNFTITKIK